MGRVITKKCHECGENMIRTHKESVSSSDDIFHNTYLCRYCGFKIKTQEKDLLILAIPEDFKNKNNLAISSRLPALVPAKPKPGQ